MREYLTAVETAEPWNITIRRVQVLCNQLRVLSLFSGCGGIDLGFEGDFNVLTASVNPELNPSWSIDKVDERWSHLGKTSFHTVFANDIKPEAKAAWTNYFFQ